MMTAAALPLPSNLRDFATRLFGSMWFLFLAVFVAQGTLGDVHSAAWFQSASRLCLSIFYLLLWWLILSRPPAISQATAIVPRIAAFVGTYMPWGITLVARDAHVTPNLLSPILVITGTLFMIFTVSHLGRSFSLVPQARRLVLSGPYRYIRHPLYLAEEIALVGVVLQVMSPLTVLILVGHITVQVSRILYEEELLDEALPQYHCYAASTWRLVPLVW
jgi:protein-S-isoprenylcysteine O-methyltransferase Ste14